MSDDFIFELDTSGEPSKRSSRVFYNTIGSLEISEKDISSKPSQERPAILKTKTKRYHEQDQKKFKPGQLSDDLRNALGLRRLEIPEHIYRMRHLGYPPGWLKKAEVKSDVITIFGANNEVVKSNNSDINNVKYDGEKILEFPGFNTRKCYDWRHDYCREKGFMEMQEDCLLENFKKFLRDKKMLGRELTDITEIRSSNSSVRNSGTDFNFPTNPKKRKPMAESTPSKGDVKRLKIEKNNLEEELSDGEVVDEDDFDDEEIIDDFQSTQCSTSDADQSKLIDSFLTENSDQSKLASNNNNSFSSRKDNFVTEDGTMLLVSSVMEKPSLDRFSEGINEHRLFENLPNVGGTYQKVKNILKKVRS